jgi:methanethiol S-methyltransferase
LCSWPGRGESCTRPQRTHQLATSGPYAWVRHPQYVAFVLIMLGFLLQWPTLLTLVMFPLLVWMYARLARAEEREVAREFGEAYASYAAETPRFIPRRGRRRVAPPGRGVRVGGR